MLQKLIHQHQQAIKLEQTILAMPEYPVYRVSSNCFVIYIAGQPYEFGAELDARLRQLEARAAWLRADAQHERTASQ